VIGPFDAGGHPRKSYQGHCGRSADLVILPADAGEERVSEFPILDFQHRYLTADVAMPDKERNGPDLDTIEPSRAEDQSRPSVPTAMIR
jgi:hypothetical protein